MHARTRTCINKRTLHVAVTLGIWSQAEAQYTIREDGIGDVS